MNALQKTLFIIALLTLSAQTIRHVYVQWVEPTGSVLDKYAPPVSEDIKKAESLDELVKRYEEAKSKVKAADSNTGDPTVVAASKSETEPYKSESLLEAAIRDWEGKAKEIFELRFFWLCGLVLLVLGLVCYKRLNPWPGLALMIAGFSEMIWWTSPSFRGIGAFREFDKLLTNKILFSLMTIILLLIVAYLVSASRSKKVTLDSEAAQ